MQTTMRAAVALGAALALLGLAACDRESRSSTTTTSTAATTPDASSQVIGVKPAEPSASEPPGVTPVDGNASDVSKKADSTQRPLEGDNHSYSTEAAATPQKADGTNAAASPSSGGSPR